MGGGFYPVPLNHEELVAVIEDMLLHVREHDSFEGFLNYLLPDVGDTVPENTYAMVEARYRIGNREGQGGMRMVGEMREQS